MKQCRRGKFLYKTINFNATFNGGYKKIESFVILHFLAVFHGGGPDRVTEAISSIVCCRPLSGCCIKGAFDIQDSWRLISTAVEL